MTSLELTTALKELNALSRGCGKAWVDELDLEKDLNLVREAVLRMRQLIKTQIFHQRAVQAGISVKDLP